jgi:hypothetical protein
MTIQKIKSVMYYVLCSDSTGIVSSGNKKVHAASYPVTEKFQNSTQVTVSKSGTLLGKYYV